jgi:prophage regulatory protein
LRILSRDAIVGLLFLLPVNIADSRESTWEPKMSATEILARDCKRKKERAAKRESKRERRRHLIAEARQRARVAVGVAGIPRILRLAEVEIVTGRTRTDIYDAMRAGRFPLPVPLGGRSVGWLESEITAWLELRIAERDEKRRVANRLEAPA